MKPYISIGITTYSDTANKKFALQFYDAYQDHLPVCTPDRMKIWSSKSTITNKDEFANIWCYEAPVTIKANRGKGPIIKQWKARLDTEWRRSRAGGGKVKFRPSNRPEQPDTLSMKHPYRVRADWLGFFKTLIEISTPAHAMLHLFSEQEVQAWHGTYSIGDKPPVLNRFDGPVVGEDAFTYVLSDFSDPRKQPSDFEAARKMYRYLPELSWANYLGPEFNCEYDIDTLQKGSEACEQIGEGILFTASDQIGDIIKDRAGFLKKRNNLRSAFEQGFFRLQSLEI